MAQLCHPHVVAVYDVLSSAGDTFVVMELLPGGTLRGWLDRQARGWQEVLARFVQAGRGLAAAHAAGLVHRDFKPDNVLLTATGAARVGDFGLVRADVRRRSVVLKPNLVEFFHRSSVNTDPRVVVAAANALRRLGASSVVVAEGPGHRRDTEAVVVASGLREAVDDAGVHPDQVTPAAR